MIFKSGDMFARKNLADVILVTCNAFVRKDGRLVMGRGAAKQAADMYPGCASIFGSHLTKHDHAISAASTKPKSPYGIVIEVIADATYPMVFDPALLNPLLGIFQVKNHWHDQASLDLIEYSVKRLRIYAKSCKGTISLNYPGIGNGGLPRYQVAPLLKILPDNVIVWEL